MGRDCNLRIQLCCGLTLGVMLLAGCTPLISWRVDTIIAPDESCSRKVIVRATPSKESPNQQVSIRNYLDLPDASLYENFVSTPTQLVFGGRFRSPIMMPTDFTTKKTADGKAAHNRILYRRVDLVLMEVMDYEERIVDTVDREQGEKALDKLVHLLLDEVLKVLHKRYDSTHDLTAAASFLRDVLPLLARRLYDRLWDMRRARRGGLTFLSEEKEWQAFLRTEASRYGIDLDARPTKAARKSTERAVATFVDAKLGELTKPHATDTPPLSLDLFRAKDTREELFEELKASVSEDHDSLEAFAMKLRPLFATAFGAFLANRFSLIPTSPRLDFQVRLALPGHILHTNGLRDLDGRILWSFTDAEVGLTGYSMWARCLLLRTDRIKSLGLVGFPGHITTVERFFREIKGNNGVPHPALVAVLEECVEESSLAPLKTMAQTDTDLEMPEDLDQATVEASARILKLLERFLPRQEPEVEPELQGVGPDRGNAPRRSLASPSRAEPAPDGPAQPANE